MAADLEAFRAESDKEGTKGNKTVNLAGKLPRSVFAAQDLFTEDLEKAREQIL